MRLNTKIKSVEGRKSVVEELLEERMITKAQAGYLADYLLFYADPDQTGKERSAEYPIVTKNREVTVTKRQVSFEETVEALPNGEDGIYSMIVNDKDALLDMRAPITDSDKASIPGIAENLEVIESLKTQLESAQGQRKYSLKCQIISKYQELYTLKSSYSGVPSRTRVPSQIRALAATPIPEKVTVGEDGLPHSDAIVTILRPDHVHVLLSHYRTLKQETAEDFSSDMHYLLIDLERTALKALSHDPALADLLAMEIDGYTGAEIADYMRRKHGISHTEQYYSVVWHSKIPKMIAEEAQKRWLVWHYTFEDPSSAHWKVCNTCGRVKLAHPFFFNRNASKDGFYSMCKCCRAEKHRLEKDQGKE